MKINKFAAVLTAALMLSPMTAFAAGSQKTVFPQFNKNEVNGTVTVTVPEECTADITITFDSPEGLAFPYYTVTGAESGDYSFDIEGRDNTKDDYRYYNLSVDISSEKLGKSTAPFTDVINGTDKASFLIPDKNDNPDSFKNYSYIFTADGTAGENAWDVTASDKTSKTVAMHLISSVDGDVNGDGRVDGIDATAILTAYAQESVGKDSGFTEPQRKTADINGDEKMDGNDATLLLSYYTFISTDGKSTLAEFVASRK